MRIDFYISPAERDAFASSCEAVIRNVGTATKAATEQACQEILEESLKQVPRETGALASTAFYEVTRRMATKRYTYEGVVGYAGQSGVGMRYDRLNPVSGVAVSSYARRVHEDLSAMHIGGGKAKFLEDPVRAYAENNFKRVAQTHWVNAIHLSNAGGASIIPTEV